MSREMPIRRQGAAALAPPPADTRPKILVVDDRKENLLATAKVLKGLDAELLTAGSGNEALSLVLRHTFAVVLLDVQMPEMDGFETAQLMQEHESMENTPIIFVTAISKEEHYASRAANIGAVDYIFKPINPDILRSKVRVYLDLHVQREQILKLNSVLRQSNEELERFAYICSHDMQEPVRMMHSFSGMLARSHEATLDETGRRYLRFITDNATQMQKMIGDILTFSRIGREAPEIETVDCAALCDEVLAKFADVVESKAAKVTLAKLPTVQTSPTLMRVLFQNLVGNGLKFQDGSRAPEIAIKAQRHGAAWQFSVRDNGIGIDPAFHDKMFAIFQRHHRKEDYPGTGIGLCTCKKFLELYGGAISFTSILGKGTIFTFTIPDRAPGEGTTP
jgi:two-component system sensor histidine kinase/response regulator